VASKLMVMLAYHVGRLPEDCKEAIDWLGAGGRAASAAALKPPVGEASSSRSSGTSAAQTSSSGSSSKAPVLGCHGGDTSQQCKSIKLQQEGLTWAARHCLSNVMTNFLHTAELLGSLLDNRGFWVETVPAPAATVKGLRPSHSRSSSSIAEPGHVRLAAGCEERHAEAPAGAEEDEGGSGVSNPCSSSDRRSRRSSSGSGSKWQPHSTICAELVSKQPKHGSFMRETITEALTAPLRPVYRLYTGPDGRTYLLSPSNHWPEDVVRYAVESLGSAVQEYGIVEVLQTLALAKQLPEWSEPAATPREKGFEFWDLCMNAVIGGEQYSTGDLSMYLKGSESAMAVLMMACIKILPGVVHLPVEQTSSSDRWAAGFAGQHAFVANLKGCIKLDAALTLCRNILRDTVLQVSFCCCNPDCTSLQGFSELGLVFKAEGSSTSSNSQKGCRPIGGGVCSGCGVSCYCSRKCQRQHWAAGHRKACRRSAKPK
jgi:hypothetical protein